MAVVGARRHRQGTGEYVAREFMRCGCSVCAIVGTTRATVEAARRVLRERHGIECSGFLSLEALLENEPVDMIAVCSPANTHLPLLDLAVEARCHVFCEKPLWWTSELVHLPNARAEIREQATQLVDRCVRQGRYLTLNTQWPFTLEAFRELHPDAYGDERTVEHFSMWLSPTSGGLDMVVEAGPHLVSMLQALLGPGTLHDIQAKFKDLAGLGTHAELLLTCAYKHGQGETQVEFRLTRCPEPPRPAGYSINGMAAERHVELPDYVISFVNKGKRASVRDPLAISVENFVSAVQVGRLSDRTSVVDGMTQLHELVVAAMSREQ
ncbi:MAG: Gfo/Idh/MocA family oxidoreductase [Gammaproteobacteria bacterium]|nr:Gfo/Idh/MocA family oxidoreductase [Gammaproteobacteria bacterium]